MANKIVYSEPELSQMIEALRLSARKLRNSKQNILLTASRIQDGAITGLSGNTLVGGLENGLSGAYESIADQLEQRARFIERELEQFKAAIRESTDY